VVEGKGHDGGMVGKVCCSCVIRGSGRSHIDLDPALSLHPIESCFRF
jgi:hypothetical protein